MERTAGMESRAKTTSVSSMAMRASRRMVIGGAAVFEDEEVSWRGLTGWRRLSQAIQRGVGGLLGRGWGKEQADGGDEQDGGEDVGDPGEAGEQGDAAGDEEAAHEDGSGDSPEEDLGLAGAVDLEEAEEQKEDEEVVDGERLFEGVAGEVLDGGGGPRVWRRKRAKARAAAIQRAVAAMAVRRGDRAAERLAGGGRRRARAASRRRWLMRRMVSRKRSAEIWRDWG
jgi:hypothetical protein